MPARLLAMNLAELQDQYFAVVYLRAGTLRLHRHAAAHFSRLIGGDSSDLTDANIVRYAHLRTEAGASTATVHFEQCKILALWRFAAKRRIVDEWPTVKPMRSPQRVPQAWTHEQLSALFAASRLAGPVGDVCGPDWWLALFSFLWDSGERISAVLSIDWSGVDLSRRLVIVRAEHRKGGQRDAAYEISIETAAALDKLPRIKPPFAWPYDLGTLYNRLRKILQAAGLPTDRRSMFHRIRRSFASHLEAAGGDATSALGHSSRRVTVASYLDPSVCGGPAPVTRLFRP